MDLQSLLGKNIIAEVDSKLSSRNRLVLNGMGLKVVSVSADTLFAQPLPKEFKHKIIQLPIHLYDLFWHITDVWDD